MAFNGEYQHSLDEKGRVIMAMKFRDALGSRFVLTKGMEACLFAYPLEEWRKLENQLDTLAVFNRSNRDFKRRFFSGSIDVDTDKQGRINLTPEMIAYAGLNKEVFIIGAGDHVEIWDRLGWEEYREQLNKDYESLAEDLGL